MTGPGKGRRRDAMARIAVALLLVTLVLGVAGCRFSSEKYWTLPASYGLNNAIEKGSMPDGWIQFYAATAIVDLLMLPVTLVHDFFILLLDPPAHFAWQEKRLVRQMVNGY